LVLEIEDLHDEKGLEEELATNEENESKDDLDKLKALPKIDAKSIRRVSLRNQTVRMNSKNLVADKITALE
jgi:hypothetical protein